MSCEASYFAELDNEELVVEDPKMEQQLQPVVDASCPLDRAQQATEGQDVHSSSQSHAAMQTPDVAWLAAHHPALQV